jgi:hypothetical protein
MTRAGWAPAWPSPHRCAGGTDSGDGTALPPTIKSAAWPV